jgi:acetoacetyl-CoA synthetase
MPVCFWGDTDGSRYRDAYFAHYPGVWRHGDWIRIYPDGACLITGRSDATLNRGGVRLGTAEFYAVVEAIDGVADSLVVHLEDDVGGIGELMLFVVSVEGRDVDDEMRHAIIEALRSDLSARHIPDRIVAVPAVPRTLSGKKLELPVKRILLGVDPRRAASAGSMVNPDALDPYINFSRSRTGRSP